MRYLRFYAAGCAVVLIGTCAFGAAAQAPQRTQREQREAAIEAARPKPPRPIAREAEVSPNFEQNAAPSPATIAVRPGDPRTPLPVEQSTSPQYEAPASTPAQPMVSNRPEYMAPSAPEVNWQNNQLTIVSHNSTMADVLAAVKNATGAKIEGPLSGASDRVATRLGPGPADDVLAALLKGSRYDYIILGSNAEPGSVKRVVLTLRPAGGAAMASSGPSYSQPRPPVMRQPEPDPEEDVVQEEPEPQQVPDMQDGQRAIPAPVDPNNPNDPNRVKTPEELLQELQRMQQQQQQQQQSPPNTIGEPIGQPIGAPVNVPQPAPGTQRERRPPR